MALAQPDSGARLFAREAPVEAPSTGLVVLPLPAEVLEATQPDLSDLRLHGADGREVPYLVDAGAAPRRITHALSPVRADRRIERGDSLRTHARERFDLALPEAADEDARLVLELDTSARDFVRRVVVRDAEGQVLGEGTVFRLDDARARLTLEIARPAPPGLVTVELVGEGGYLEPRFALVEESRGRGAEVLARPLAVVARRRVGDRTVFELERPVGIRPDRLRIATSTGHFTRPMRVLDLAAGEAPRPIGAGTAFRVRELGVEELTIPLEAARGETLRVIVEDGDAPPLDGLAFEAVVRQPALVWDSTGPVTLRFSGGRARAPRYDLARLGASALGRRVLAHAHPEATLGAIRANPAFDDGPALAFALVAGREPDLASYSHVADVEVTGAREGLSLLRVPPAVQARARDDLGDLRVIDGDGRQWPYVVSPTALPDRVGASVEVERTERGTRYVIRPESGRAKVASLRFQPDASYVLRPYTLVARDGDARVEIGHAMIRRDPDEVAPIVIAIDERWVDALELTVEDGDDAPLALEGVAVDVVSPTLYLAARDGEYRLLVGAPEARPPVYQIARAPELLRSVRPGTATVGAPRANPDRVEPPWYAAAGAGTLALWVTLLLALLILGVLTLRLARAPKTDGDEGAPPPTSF